MEETAALSPPKNKWAERLRGRARMAVAVIGGLFLLGFLGVSRPLGQRIDDANTRITKAEARAQLAGEVAGLRRQAGAYNKKLSRGVDLNDWTNYLLGGIRTQRVKLIRMDPKDVVTLGPCKIITWQVEMEGDFKSLAKIVEWIENGQRLMRIDRLIMQSPGGGGGGVLVMSMTLRGLALDVPDKNKTNNPTSKPAKIVPALDKKPGSAEGKS